MPAWPSWPAMWSGNRWPSIDDPEIRRSIAGIEPPEGHVLISTIDYTPETHERYTLTRLHARGGIGQVWLARDADLGRDVALKELRPEQANNPVVWSRFLEEAKITGQLEHPNIVPVHELRANRRGPPAVLHHAVRQGPHPLRGDRRHSTVAARRASPTRSSSGRCWGPSSASATPSPTPIAGV